MEMSMRDNVPVRTMIDMIIKGSIKGFSGLYVNLLSHSKDRRKDDRTITIRNTVSLVSIIYL
ncbi:hypothetical protein MSMAT_0529 [Methanosarcina mazei TMA]|nr:hypothetical protein MSMAT_0529 [Methanosarcina mazei TMA]